MLRALASAVLVLALMVLGAGMAFADGGAPPEEPAPGVRLHRPIVEEHSFARRAADDACELQARVWLAGSWGEARALRDITVTGEAIAREGSGEMLPDGRRDLSTQVVPFAFAWQGGWWWRFESERVDVVVPLACETRAASVTLQFHATSLTGRDVDHPETFELALEGPAGG